MRSFLEKSGLYDPTARYAFTNITDEVFTSHWDGIPIVVQPHQTIEVSIKEPIMNVGEALAIHMTNQLVDMIITGEIHVTEAAMQEKLQNPYWRSPKGMSLNIPNVRKPYEDQILKKLESEQDETTLATLRKQVMSDVTSQNAAQPSTAPVDVQLPRSLNEFADLAKTAPAGEKSPAKVKVIK